MTPHAERCPDCARRCRLGFPPGCAAARGGRDDRVSGHARARGIADARGRGDAAALDPAHPDRGRRPPGGGCWRKAT
jgi:hypothetical protein